MTISDEAQQDGLGCKEHCKLASNPVCGDLDSAVEADFDAAEREIMTWAAENPEMVYPTWWKYLCMIGVIPEHLGDKTLGEATVEGLMETHIQSDIAQKLGIELKEG